MNLQVHLRPVANDANDMNLALFRTIPSTTLLPSLCPDNKCAPVVCQGQDAPALNLLRRQNSTTSMSETVVFSLFFALPISLLSDVGECRHALVVFKLSASTSVQFSLLCLQHVSDFAFVLVSKEARLNCSRLHKGEIHKRSTTCVMSKPMPDVGGAYVH